jgi:hypothetical protein
VIDKRRGPLDPADRPTDQEEPVKDPDTIYVPAMRFAGLCGAIVAVSLDERGHRHRWDCQGCGDGVGCLSRNDARKAANAHASACRALPRT